MTQNESGERPKDCTGGAPAERQAVMVELRVPAAETAAKTLDAAANALPGLELDRDYEPVPVAPSAGEAAAGKSTVIVRGTVAESDVAELEKRDGVVRVWKDTPIQPFG